MFAILFLGVSGLGVWVGVTLMNKSTKDDDIKALLADIANNIFRLIDGFMILIKNFKNLIMMLNSVRNEDRQILSFNKNKEKVEPCTPTLLNIQNQDD